MQISYFEMYKQIPYLCSFSFAKFKKKINGGFQQSLPNYFQVSSITQGLPMNQSNASHQDNNDYVTECSTQVHNKHS